MEILQAHNHSIFFANGTFDFFSNLIESNNYSSLFVLVDSNTETHCLPRFLAKYPLPENLEVISIDAGEEHKHIETCLSVWEALSELGADRKSLLINLGGGVVTDLGGFVAATFKRGIDFINIPTSLLAMVDASVGGKTGVDLGPLKNQVGLIINPQGVVIDPIFLDSLPANEYRSGYAEMLKHGLIQDPDYWKRLADFSSINTSDITQHIKHSVGIKLNVVTEDPTEQSLRKILNFGHTLGHAIESYFLTEVDKTTLLHGEAIAIGMILEAFLSRELLGMPADQCKEIKTVFTAIYPKVNFEQDDLEAINKLLVFDKKNSHGKVKFALLKAIGQPQWDIEVTSALLTSAFAYYREA
ncbi:3-dehydroquinate synthase [Flavobacteriaceae bacterium]|nr:3-dehydroquinate synthase [Flavobacteriaceae bacterium]